MAWATAEPAATAAAGIIGLYAHHETYARLTVDSRRTIDQCEPREQGH
jgi:hypothetical protein